MITMNRVTIRTLDCPGCGGRFESNHRHGDAYASSCPTCGHSPEVADAP